MVRIGQKLRAAGLLLALLWIPARDSGAQPAYSYALIVGPTVSVDGFTPSSLIDSGEVIYADNFNGTISTTTDTLTQVDDVIGGERISWVAPGSETSLNDDGEAVFEARYGDADLPAIFTPTELVAKHHGDVDGWRIESPASPCINASGRIVFAANICPIVSCVASAIFLDGIEQIETPFSDGFHEVTSVSHPMINDDDLMGFYGRAYLAGHAAVYVYRSGQSPFRVVRDGVNVGAGVVLGNPGGAFAGYDLNDSGDVATTWTTDTGQWVVVKNEELVAIAGDSIGGIVLTELSGHRPALNDAGTVVFRARHAGGDGVFTKKNVVLTAGQAIGDYTVQFLSAVAINDSGAIAMQVSFESGLHGIVLATPLDSNHYVRMRTGSAVALRQQVDVPADSFAMRFDHRFTTTAGQLQVRLDGAPLGSASAPGSVAEDATRSVFQVSGEILGTPDVTLELELDGPTGSTLELDNVFFPGLVNGSFEEGDLSDWETVTPGSGSVELVPEPSALLSSLACSLTLAMWSHRSRRRRVARIRPTASLSEPEPSLSIASTPASPLALAAFLALTLGVPGRPSADVISFDSLPSGTIVTYVDGVTFSLLSEVSDTSLVVSTGRATTSAPNYLGARGGRGDPFLPGDVIGLAFASPVRLLAVSVISTANTPAGVFELATPAGRDVSGATPDRMLRSDELYALSVSSSVPFSSAEIRASANNLYAFSVDDVVHHAPEPAAPMTAAASMCGLAWLAGRRRRAMDV